MQPTQFNNRTVRMILHPDREIYSIGESIRPKLQIQNSNDFPIEISGGFVFSWDELSFSRPNAAHLLGPDGQDRLLAYQQPTSFTDHNPPIRVEAKEEEWLYLPISNHLHLRQIGEYTFWLELLDNSGQLHESNHISFRLVDIESSIPHELIKLILETQKSAFATTEPVDLEAVFTNQSKQSITFLKPQEDSFDGWVNPVYQFTVLDSAGRSQALARRSGTMAKPVYNEMTKFTVAPGKFYREKLRLPTFPKMRNPGEYQVQLTYIVRERAIGKGGVILDRQMDWEEGIFIGRIQSTNVTITIG